MRIPRIVPKSLFKFALLGVMGAGMWSRCAQIGMPQGGPRDSLPPKVVAMTPAFGTKNFTGKRIYIEFDEYVLLKDQQKEFFISPFQNKNPNLSIKGRGIQIDIQDTLRPNQTYALNFGRSVFDNNESNPYVGLRYVFSTGSEIDSLLLSGYTVDAYTCDTVPGSFILLFDPAADSIPGVDSTLYKASALAVGKAFPNGIFLAENLKGIPYRIFALEDKNGNQKYEPGVDRIAFLDSVCNPLEMSSFDVWYDTIRQYLQADPQMLLRLFMEPPVRRQALSSAKRVAGNRLEFYFGAPYPRIRELSLEGIESSRIQREYLTQHRDSIRLWIDSLDLPLPDTILGRLIYLRQDSVRNYFADTVSLKLGWKAPPQRREERRKAADDEKPRNPFQVTVTPSGTVNPEKHLLFAFEAPLVTLDTTAIRLEELPEGEKATPRSVKLTFSRDSVKLREWTLAAAWKPGGKYRLMIPAGTFRNVNGESNDTLKADFGIADPEKFATLVMDIKGMTPESKYVIELIDETGRVIDRKQDLTTSKHAFRYIPAGNVRIRITDDRNSNGRWDTGSVLERRQPERVEMYIAADGTEILVAKENWETEYLLDMAEIFAPMTMERMQRIIAQREAVLQKKREEDRERYRQQGGNSRNTNSQSGGRSQSQNQNTRNQNPSYGY